MSQVVILSLLVFSIVASASTPGPRRLNHDAFFDKQTRSNGTATRTMNRRTAGAPVTPSDWPTTTQAGATPSITAVTAADPYLNSLSYALNNAKNSLWTATYSGDLTYYDTASVACGDVYTDSDYIAAISESLFDSWPGFTSGGNTNRNPVCGPWTPGRQIQNQVTGVWETVVASADGTMQVGGDGLPNCLSGSKCHIPMTATVTNPATGLSVVVQIVDRCGGCAYGDIDLTPTAFSAIADTSLGRVHDITWVFNTMGGAAPGTTSSSSSKATSSTSSSKANSATSTSSTKTTTPSTSTSSHTTSKLTTSAPASSTVTTSAAPTTSAAAGGSCSGFSAWNASVAYTGGQEVTYGGYLWSAQYWTEDSVPGGVAGVWTKISAC